MLKIKNINAYYGKVHALKNVSLHLNRGEIVTLIGANGAGKTTLLNTLSGLIPTASGEIALEGKNIAGHSADRVVSLGLSQVPEGRQVFNPLTVEENLELGAYLRYRAGGQKSEIAQDMEHMYRMFPRLKERRRQAAGTLSGGEQQMLAMGRALMSRPKLLLLDEPSMGLAPMLVEQIFQIIQEINATGTTILLVEQNAHMALSIAHRAYVLETGRIVLSGTAKEIAEDPQVKAAYLGV